MDEKERHKENPLIPKCDWISSGEVEEFARKCGCDQILVIASKPLITPHTNGREAAIVIWQRNPEHEGFMQRLKQNVVQLYQRLIKG